MKDLKKLGAEVIDVSGDAPRNLGLFKKVHDLNFTLLAEEKGEIARKFGVPAGKGGSIEKEIDGKKEVLVRGVTTGRWTFVIDRSGKVAYRNAKVRAQRDLHVVIEVLEKLEGRKKGVEVGDRAPVFEVRDDRGKTWKSVDHVGKKPIVVFFYPAAFTGG